MWPWPARCPSEFDTPVLYRTTTRVCHPRAWWNLGSARSTPAPLCPQRPQVRLHPGPRLCQPPLVEERLKKLEEYGCTRALENGLNKLEMGDGKGGRHHRLHRL